MKELIKNIKEFLNIPITQIGTTDLTLWSVLYFLPACFPAVLSDGKDKKMGSL